jgi:hypothetical protein
VMSCKAGSQLSSTATRLIAPHCQCSGLRIPALTGYTDPVPGFGFGTSVEATIPVLRHSRRSSTATSAWCWSSLSASTILLTALQVVDVGVLADPDVSAAVVERHSFTALSNDVTCTVQADLHRMFSIFGGAQSRTSR